MPIDKEQAHDARGAQVEPSEQPGDLAAPEAPAEQADAVRGGIALLLPAVQASREAAKVHDGTSNTFLVGEKSL